MFKIDAKCPRCGKRHVVDLEYKYIGRGLFKKYCRVCETAVYGISDYFNTPAMDDVEFADTLNQPTIDIMKAGYICGV